MAVITAKFGKCAKCGCDVTGKKVNWEVGSKQVSCVACSTPAQINLAASLSSPAPVAAPAKVSLPAPVKSAPVKSAPVASKLVRIKLKHTFAHNVERKDGGKGISMYLVGSYTVSPSGKAVFFTGNYDAKESVNCLHCGRNLENHNSRIVGYGPICCENLGIPRPNFDKMEGQEIEKLMQTIRAMSFQGWIPKSCVETEEEISSSPAPANVEKVASPAPVSRPSAPVVSADPFQTMDSNLPGITWEGTGKEFRTVQTGSHILVTKQGKNGAYKKLRRVAEYGDTRKVWEGEGKNIRCLTVNHKGEVIGSESLYMTHSAGLF